MDAEVGYEFDKNRTNTRMGNFTVYGLLGLKKGVEQAKTLGELVASMETDESSVFEGDSRGLGDYIKDPFSFNFNDLVEGVKKVTSFHNNQNLVALNINSYMGGVSDIWKNGKVNEAIKTREAPTEPSQSDGKIEFVSFTDTGKLGLEKALKGLEVGFAERIVQGRGPFIIKFK